MLDSQVVTIMVERNIEAWLVYDYRGNNPILRQLLGGSHATTRRVFLFLPVSGKARLFCHAIEAPMFTADNVQVETYTGWADMYEALGRVLSKCQRVAMEYSAQAELPTVSWVDGGTLERVRSFGVEVVSSAPLMQSGLSRWSASSLISHKEAVRHVVEVRDLAFAYVADRVRSSGTCTEYEVQELIVDEFGRRDLEMGHRPIVGINKNSGNPHYEPTADHNSRIQRGDWLLIDLWGRLPGEHNIFADITWVASLGPISPQQQRAFEAVRRARDAVIMCLQEERSAQRCVEGWQLDRLARAAIAGAGYGDAILHRTGHSLGPGPSVHGLGANLDDLETHDTREIITETGFTVEPGIYLPEFGVRLEVNVYLDADRRVEVTTPIQDEILLLE